MEIEKDLEQETSVAESREQAREARALTESESRLRRAIRAAETAHTEAAREALIEALKKSIDDAGKPHYAVSATGDRVALTGGHGLGVLIDLNTRRKTPLCGGPLAIDGLSFSPDDKYLLVVRSLDGLSWDYELWDTKAAVPLDSAQLQMPPNPIRWSRDSSSFFLTFDRLDGYRITSAVRAT
jgi:WD40 repeat protein